ncbi:MAG: aminodeoxychorismate synthase, component I [Desulfobacteraceae bacterium 4572_89]|nr:MAG: aminodeoxychorismate synthase, component I [Desulfobacteraceae bacterium 4572_89]
MSGIQQLPRVSSLFLEEIEFIQPFEQAAARFASKPGTIVLLSGSGPDNPNQDPSRFNILALDPWLELKGYQERLSLGFEGQTITVNQDPFALLQELLDHCKLDVFDFNSLDQDHSNQINLNQVQPGADLPIFAGLFGYFSYDLKDRIETLPRTCVDTHLPDICLYAPSIILIQDCLLNKTFLCIPILDHCLSSMEDYVQTRKEAFYEQLDQAWKNLPFSIDGRGFRSSFTKPEYIWSVEKIIQYLKAGDIYQANLSQRLETNFTGDTYSLFIELYKRNPASFFSYINAGNHYIVSTSPERFIKLDGNQVETRPIKGTIARGKTHDQDRENGLYLTQSIKDDAELTMIVDLMRNDLSRVTKHGSVVVSEHKRLEPYENVFHLVSIVRGELENQKTIVDLLRATFPGGSITGCPKIRSMEIIDELEPVKRHVYTGSIGYISFHGTMDLSIAIRTATIVDDNIFFSVGGGIVYDSDPEKEFQETLDKGKTLMETLESVSSRNDIPCLRAWVDGKIIDQDQAMISALSPGFQYGAGLFETIRVENGRPLRLAAHVQRMNRAWTSLFGSLPPDITWEHVIDLVIKENGFQDMTCAVKLMISRDEQANGKQAFLAAFARPYVHRLDLNNKTGLDLVSYPHPRLTLLSDYKTQNYLYYDQAAKYAVDHGADEALILNPDHTISETNTCNMLMVKKNEVILPSSDHVLPGVTLNTLLDILALQGYTITRKKIRLQEIHSYPNILVTNALMGVVRVLSIDEERIDHDKGISQKINGFLAEG